jgi:hypothetical protein
MDLNTMFAKVADMPANLMSFPIDHCVGKQAHIRIFANAEELGITHPIFAIGTNIVIYANKNEFRNGNPHGLYYANTVYPSEILDKLQYDPVVALGMVKKTISYTYEIISVNGIAFKEENVLISYDYMHGFRIHVKETVEREQRLKDLHDSLLLPGL